MKPLRSFNQVQARYLWRKYRSGNISLRILLKLTTEEGFTDLVSWFWAFDLETYFP